MENLWFVISFIFVAALILSIYLFSKIVEIILEVAKKNSKNTEGEDEGK